MVERTAHVEWTGTVQAGAGTLDLGSGAFSGAYTAGSRFEDEDGTNPEELIGAAHASCFSMALAMMLGEAGHEPERIETDATVSLDMDGDIPRISGIALSCTAQVPDISLETFERIAAEAKETCPVSAALDVPITLEATLA